MNDLKSIFWLTLCAILTTSASAFATSRAFTDSDLAELLENSKRDRSKIMIYTWSPHMMLSVNGLAEVRRNPRKYRVLPLLDPDAHASAAKRTQSDRGFPEGVMRTLESPKLVRAGARMHYPSYIFIKNGKISGPLIPGYKHPSTVDRLARVYL